MNHSFIAAFFFLLPTIIYCQDKNLEAQMHYTNAEDKFTKGGTINYQECLDELAQAEKILENTNPKILYLKIKTLSAVSKLEDVYYYYDLDTSVKIFFKITDANNYPIEKYTEILQVKTQLDKKITEIGNQKYNLYKSSEFKNSDSALLMHAKFLLRRYDLNSIYQIAIPSNSSIAETALLGKISTPTEANMNKLVNALEKLKQLTQDEEIGKRILIDLSRKNNIDAMLELSNVYKWTEQKDAEESILQKAISLGSVKAMHYLSIFYSIQADQFDISKKQKKEYQKLSEEWKKKAKDAVKSN